MQSHGGVDAEDAVLAAERRFFIDIKFDWDKTGAYAHYLSDLSEYVSAVKVDRSLSGSAPQELMLIEGSAAAELSVTLGGEDALRDDLDFTGVFSPYNGLSPFYNYDLVGSEVKYRIGVETVIGIIWYDQFVGNVRTITPNRGSNSVTITALDRVEKLRVPVKFPSWSLHSYWMDRGWTKAQLAASHWVIDHCIRHANVSPSPNSPWFGFPPNFPWTGDPRDQGPQFYLTGNGSHVPSVGWVDQARRQGYPLSETGRAMYADVGMKNPDSSYPNQPMALAAMANDSSGPGGFNNGLDFYTSVTNTAELRYWAQDRIDQPGNGTYWMGFTLNANGASGGWWKLLGNTSYAADFFIGWHRVVRFVLKEGSFRVEVRNRVGTAPFPGQVTTWKAVPNQDHVQIDVIVNASDENNIRVWTDVGGNIANDENIGAVTFDSNFDNHQGLIIVRHHAAISDVYWTARWVDVSVGLPSGAQFGYRKADYLAVLDEGLNQLTHMPATIYEDAWQVITEVAAAEYGSVFWDEHGVFHFWNRNTLLDKQATVVRELNIDDVSGLQITNSLDSVRNVVTASSRMKTSDNAIVYSSSNPDELYVPNNTAARKLKIYIEGVESVNPNKVTRFSTVPGAPNQWDPNGQAEGYVVQFLKSGVWVEDDGATSGVDILPQLDENGNLVLYIWNGYGWPVRFATNSGSPALRVAGTFQTDNGEVAISVEDDDSIKKFGSRNLSVTGDWVQWQPETIDRLVGYLLPRTVTSIPTTDAIVIAGDPRLQLGDCVTVSDPSGLGEEIKLQIYGISREITSSGGLTDTLSVEMIQPPRIGIWDSAQYGLWDNTFIWSA